MTTQTVRVFLPILRRVEGELRVPVRDRLRILRELEFDLEELRRRLEGEGLPKDVARARSLEALVPDGAALRELGRLHTPWYQRVTGQLSQERVRVLERSALAILTIFVLLGQTTILHRTDVFRSPSPFIWPVLGLGAIAFAVAVEQAFALWVRRAHPLRHPGSPVVLLMAGATLGLGVFGALVDTYQMVMTLGGPPMPMQPEWSSWLMREAGLLSVSLVLALAGGLAWFVLTQWLTLVSGALREVLGLDQPETHHQEG